MIEAWRKDTGEKLDYLVPKAFIGHPQFGKNLLDKEPNPDKPADDKPAEGKPADEKKGAKK